MFLHQQPFRCSFASSFDDPSFYRFENARLGRHRTRIGLEWRTRTASITSIGDVEHARVPPVEWDVEKGSFRFYWKSKGKGFRSSFPFKESESVGKVSPGSIGNVVPFQPKNLPFETVRRSVRSPVEPRRGFEHPKPKFWFGGNFLAWSFVVLQATPCHELRDKRRMDRHVHPSDSFAAQGAGELAVQGRYVAKVEKDAKVAICV